MEIKKHHHTVPIVMIISALLTLAVVTINHLTTRQYALTRGLTTHVINIQPAKNGLAKITKSNMHQVGSDWTQAGAVASLSLNLQ